MYKYIVEKYTNKLQTKEQCIEINTIGNPEEVDKDTWLKRSMIDPELTWLYAISYLDDERKKKLTEYYDIEGRLIRKEEPWIFDSSRNKNIYSKGGIENETNN